MERIGKINFRMSNFAKSKFGKAVSINIVYLVGMLIFFEPFLSIDDIAISNYLYGAYQGGYDYHTLYSSFLYGRIVFLFLSLFPGLPWYTILAYVWTFIALTLLTYAILCWDDSSLGVLLINIILLFFSYESYVCIQFTKISAIIGTAGIFVFTQKEQKKVVRVVGACLLFFAILIRRQASVMIIAGWSIMLVINWVRKCIKEKKWDIKGIVWLGGCIAIVFFIYELPLVVPKYISEAEETEWEDFYDWSDARVTFQDYDIPQYAEYKEMYDALGVSENDLYVWYSWNFDPDGITTEIGEEVSKQQNKGKGNLEKVISIATLFNFFKTYLEKLETNDCFFAFLLLAIMLGICSRGKLVLYSFMVDGGIILLLYYYLYINGRYNDIHRVDVGIMMLACMMLIYMAMEEPPKEKLEIKKVAGACLGMLLVVPFQLYADDLPAINKELNYVNKVFYQNVHEDMFHYYVLGNSRTNSGNLRYLPTALECIPSGLYKNVFGVTSPSPIIKKNLQEYDIDNPYTGLVNNNRMYLVLDEYDSMKDSLKMYIEQHSGTEVEMVLVKKFCDKNIYRVVSKDLDEIVDINNITWEDASTISNVSMQIEDNVLKVSGNACLENSNAFSQNVYLQIVDSQTGENGLYYVTQFCDEKFSEDEAEYFAGISSTISLPDYFDMQDDVYLLIENEGTYFRTKISD